MAEGVDYAGDRPDPQQLYAAGKRFVLRYGGPGGSWKHLDAAEARALVAAGLSIVANAEGAADGLLGGWNAGASWAREADEHFRACGMPAGKPIYLSVDFDVTAAQWPRVAEALRGAASVIGAARVGVYGSYDAMVWARRDKVATWFWQTYAWSGGRWAPGNHVEQYRNGVALAGGTVDLNRSRVADIGQWGNGPEEEDDDMTKEEHDALMLVRWIVAAGMIHPTTGERVPLQVWGAGIDAALDAMATRPGLTAEELAAVRAEAMAGAAAGATQALSPAALAAAIPDSLAAEVADLLHKRLAS